MKLTDIVKLGAEPYLDMDTTKALESIPEKVRDDFTNHIYSSAFWKRIENQFVPLDLIKERKGPWNKEIGDYVQLEYFPEDYTIQELNRLFPNWWTEEMDYHYEPSIRTVIVSGYLMVEMPTLQGKVVIKRWAMGTSVIEFKKDSDSLSPSQPDDRYKAARTEWIKLAGKWYGIGLEIYHQRITPELRSYFEDIIRPLGVYANELKQIAATFETGHGFRNFLKEIPTLSQVNRIMNAIQYIPSDLTNADGKNVRQLIMANFVKSRNDTQPNRSKFETFIAKIEETARVYEKESLNKGEK